MSKPFQGKHIASYMSQRVGYYCRYFDHSWRCYDKLKCWCRWRCSEMKMNHSGCTFLQRGFLTPDAQLCTTLRITLLHTSWVLPSRLPDEKLFIDHFQPNVHKFSCSIFSYQFFTTWTRFDIRSYEFAKCWLSWLGGWKRKTPLLEGEGL